MSSLQGIFPTQGLNLCLLHWQVDSLPLSHQGSPSSFDPCLRNDHIIFAASNPAPPPPCSLQTTRSTNHSKFIPQYPVPHHSTTRSPHLPSPPGPKGTPEMEEKKLNPDPCSSSGRRGLGPGNPFPQVPAGRRSDPSMPRERGSRLPKEREHAGRSSGLCLRGRRSWEGRALPEESGSLVLPG